MPTAPAAAELLDRPSSGRVHSGSTTVRLGDVDRLGRLRLDATARYLQDIATDDANDAGLDRRFGWLVRRTLIEVRTPATLGERVDVDTWCTGIGRSWAERRTAIAGDRGACVETVSLWVQVEVETGRPAQVGDDFRSAYAEAADGRKVSARLALESPPDSPLHSPLDLRSGEAPDSPPDSPLDSPLDLRSGEAPAAAPWTVRRSDLDPFDHVNNAANWAFVEEFVEFGDRVGRAEMEFVRPMTHGPAAKVRTATRTGADGNPETNLWLTVAGEVHSAARWTPFRTGVLGATGG